MRALALLAGCAALCCACGDERNPPPKFRLEGSLTQLMDLGYDEVRVLRAPEDIGLLFVRVRPLNFVPDPEAEEEEVGTTEDYPLRVGYRFVGEEAPAGGTLDLTALDQYGGQRGVASRNVSNDPRNVFPVIVRGSITFDQQLEPDTNVTGSFHLTFENGIEIASGRTVFSKAFTAWVQP